LLIINFQKLRRQGEQQAFIGIDFLATPSLYDPQSHPQKTSKITFFHPFCHFFVYFWDFYVYYWGGFFLQEFFMNKFQKIGVAIVFASGMAFAQWWTASAPHGQVAFPWVVDCKDDTSRFDEQDSTNVCFKTMGGWWFGYLAGPAMGENPNGCRIDMADKAPGASTDTNYVKAKINGDWVSFVGPDYPSCEGPDVTNRADGTSYLKDGYLDVQFSVGTGINGPSKWEPSIAALATNFSTPSGGNKGAVRPVFEAKDMSQYGGFCLKYESNHDAGDKFYFVLGWDETDAEASPGRNFYDPWYAHIPAGTGIQTVDFAWPTNLDNPVCEKDGDLNMCADFEQEGWSKTNASPIKKAVTQMMSVKISLSSYVPKKVDFKLYAFGPKGTCRGGTPVISGKNAPSVNFAMNGKVLTASIAKPAVVQVYNLQGAMVKSQTLTPNLNTMNLSSLPTGIYMVRAPSLGYTSRVVVK